MALRLWKLSTMKSRFTDNGNLTGKLNLRRHFLRKYHADGSANVLDCCQGDGVMWGALRKEFDLAGYWGIDVKPKPGRLKLDSSRILQQPGWPQNVVDIDTYGSPWKHWFAMLPNVVRPLTVFLTIGRRGFANKNVAPKPLSKEESAALGIRLNRDKIGNRAFTLFGGKLGGIAVSYCLARACEYGIIVAEAAEADNSTATRYIGLRLEPAKKSGEPEVVTPAQPKRTRTKKESARVQVHAKP